MIPSTPQSVKMIGKNGSWMYWPLDDLAYLLKSGMLQASVAQDPVTADMQLSQRYAYVDPLTVGCRSNKFPLPPALWTHHARVATAVIGAAINFTMNR